MGSLQNLVTERGHIYSNKEGKLKNKEVQLVVSLQHTGNWNQM